MRSSLIAASLDTKEGLLIEWSGESTTAVLGLTFRDSRFD
jgi:hypothetical protein